jgi:hypothetical protein
MLPVRPLFAPIVQLNKELSKELQNASSRYVLYQSRMPKGVAQGQGAFSMLAWVGESGAIWRSGRMAQLIS